MIESLIEMDRAASLAINGLHTGWADSMMMFLSSHTVWIPLYVLTAVLMFIPKWYGPDSEAGRLRDSGRKVPFWTIALTGIIMTVLCFAFTDYFTNVIKETVQRPRPGHDHILSGLLHLPAGRGGQFGFFSGHASNTFGFALITSLIFRKKWYTWIIMAWSVAIGFSRIYLGMHFVTDVLCGIAFGTVIATIFWLLYRFIINALLFRREH